jgi:hypothetical protein
MFSPGAYTTFSTRMVRVCDQISSSQSGPRRLRRASSPCGRRRVHQELQSVEESPGPAASGTSWRKTSHRNDALGRLDRAEGLGRRHAGGPHGRIRARDGTYHDGRGHSACDADDGEEDVPPPAARVRRRHSDPLSSRVSEVRFLRGHPSLLAEALLPISTPRPGGHHRVGRREGCS